MMTNNLMNEATKIADEKKTAAETEAKTAAEIAARLETQLQKLTKLLRAELRKLNGQKCRYGTFVLKKDSVVRFGGVRQVYLLMADTRMVAWFKAGVVRGTTDLSDDCRGVPFTEAQITARFYPPHPNREYHDGTWDLQGTRYYFNGGQQESFTEVDQAPNFFRFVAERLAEWI